MVNIVDINMTKKQQYEEAREKEAKKLRIPKKEVNEEINNILSWEYPNKLQTQIEGKTSVSKISKETDTAEELSLKRPKFATETEKINNAKIGL